VVKIPEVSVSVGGTSVRLSRPPDFPITVVVSHHNDTTIDIQRNRRYTPHRPFSLTSQDRSSGREVEWNLQVHVNFDEDYLLNFLCTFERTKSHDN